MTAITVDEIKKLEKNKKDLKKEIYKKIYDQFNKKIRTSVEIGQKQTFLRVPLFIVGYPSYNLGKAADYLERQLQNSGFITNRVSQIDIYVSWDFKKQKSKKIVRQTSANPPPPIFTSSAEDDSLPSLINLKKLASKYKNA
jgi:hypothetical protein